MVDKSCCQMPGKRTNKEFTMQGWNAANLGHSIDKNPYLPTSTAWSMWNKGHRQSGKC